MGGCSECVLRACVCEIGESVKRKEMRDARRKRGV